LTISGKIGKIVKMLVNSLFDDFAIFTKIVKMLVNSLFDDFWRKSPKTVKMLVKLAF